VGIFKKVNLFIKKNLVKIRGILSTALLVISIVVTFTGIGLFFAPSGKVARETGWKFLGFDKFHLEKLHTITGFIMVAIIIVHLAINYTMYINEMKLLFKTRKR